MSQKPTEIEALAQIDSLLNQLNDEEISRIFIFISAKYRTNFSNSVKPFAANSVSAPPVISLTADMSIKEFISLKRPEGFYERIACLGYYLEKVRGMEGFKTGDISEANREARLEPMSNPTFFVNDAATKYGYLTPIGSGSKALSARGEAIVEALPDRERVKQVREENPKKKKSAKKKQATPQKNKI